MYSRVCLLCIIVTLSLGHVASKAGLEENDKKFSVNFDVIHPRDRNCEFMRNKSKCEVELSGIVDSAPLENREWGVRYIMEILIAKQVFKVQIDSGSYLLWVFGSNCLDKTDPKCKGHPKYVLDPKANYKDFKLEYTVGEISGKYVVDDVHVTKNLAIQKQLFGAAGVIDEDFNGYDGIIGLSMDMRKQVPSVFYNMVQDKLINEPILSMFVKGGKSSKDGGEITFGGHNDKLIKPNTAITTAMHPGGQTMVTMKSLSIGKYVFCSKGKRGIAFIDSGNSDIFGPIDFAEYLDQILDPKADWEVDCKKRAVAPTIEIVIGNGKLTIEQNIYIVDFMQKCYSTIKHNTEKGFDWIFGLPLFVKYYVEFNFTPKHESITFWEKA